MRQFCVVALAGFAMANASVAMAAVVPVVDPSFELGTPLPTGWSNTGSTTAIGGVSPTHGTKLRFLNAVANSRHETTTNWSPSTTYELKVDVGNRNDIPQNPTVSIELEYLSAPSTYTDVKLISGSLGTFAADGTIQTATLTITPAEVPSIAYGKPIAINLAATGSGQVLFDNVRLTAVPEAGTLFAAGTLIGTATLRRRRAGL
jgi:hypothetical protein